MDSVSGSLFSKGEQTFYQLSKVCQKYRATQVILDFDFETKVFQACIKSVVYLRVNLFMPFMSFHGSINIEYIKITRQVI